MWDQTKINEPIDLPMKNTQSLGSVNEASDKISNEIQMPTANKVILMKQNSGVDVDEIEFEIGLESSVRKEGGEREILSSGCNVYES